MTNKQLAEIHSRLRVRAGMRQADIASAAGIPRRRVVDLENARLARLRLGEIEASFAALGARLTLTAHYHGAALDRLLDDLHALILAAVLRVLTACGSEAQVEVTFSSAGDRGSIDVLAWNPPERALLVVEIKSELPGVDPLLRPLDVKVRLAAQIANRRFGWKAQTVSRVVILPEERTARRLVTRHSEVFGRALPARSREIRRWLLAPRGQLSGLWFLSVGQPGDIARNRSSIRRVQRPRSRFVHAQRTRRALTVSLIRPTSGSSIRTESSESTTDEKTGRNGPCEPALSDGGRAVVGRLRGA